MSNLAIPPRTESTDRDKVLGPFEIAVLHPMLDYSPGQYRTDRGKRLQLHDRRPVQIERRFALAPDRQHRHE
jgi:hypothetical protein